MAQLGSLAHTKWDCKYHIVWIPKYRKKRLFLETCGRSWDRYCANWRSHRESEIIEGRMLLVIMCIC